MIFKKGEYFMTPQTGGYIVIDCTPLWKETGAISIDSDGSVSEYQQNIEIAKQLKYALDKAKKPIIFNNLNLIDDNARSYDINGAIGQVLDEYDERSGMKQIVLPLFFTQGATTLLFNVSDDLTITITRGVVA